MIYLNKKKSFGPKNLGGVKNFGEFFFCFLPPFFILKMSKSSVTYCVVFHFVLDWSFGWAAAIMKRRTQRVTDFKILPECANNIIWMSAYFRDAGCSQVCIIFILVKCFHNPLLLARNLMLKPINQFLNFDFIWEMLLRILPNPGNSIDLK